MTAMFYNQNEAVYTIRTWKNNYARSTVGQFSVTYDFTRLHKQ